VDEKLILTKSTFLRGLQCQKSLALHALQPDLKPPLSIVDQFRMRQGQLVGLEAQNCYPGGSVARVPGLYALSLQRTQDLLAAGEPVIYEAAFQAADVRVVADILVRGLKGWRLIEVKSSSRVKPEHVWDVAVQVNILRAAGLEIEDASLMHLNTSYLRQGTLDHQALFTETSILNDVELLMEEVEQVIAQCRQTIKAGLIPSLPIGPQCTDPYTCDFQAHCWRDLPSPSVFDVYYIGKRAFDLYQAGVERIEDIPADQPVDKRSRFHIEAHKAGQPVVNQQALCSFLGNLHYPLSFLDFETFALALPPFDGLSSYGKVPFQYSLHIQSKPGGALEHRGFLARAGVDPRLDLLRKLVDQVPSRGSIVVYYQSFEKGVLQSLMDTFPAFQAEVQSMIERLVDLLDPFRQRAYWHPDMGGSNSLKSVLPVFASDLSYKSMDIGDGETAMVEFLNLFDEDDPERIESVRQSLWDYCCLDTLAMVRIVDGLRRLLG
jgi:hypothetical protein